MIEFESQTFHLLMIYIKRNKSERNGMERNQNKKIFIAEKNKTEERERNNLHLNYTCMFIVICIVVEFSSFKPKKKKLDKRNVYSKLLLMKQTKTKKTLRIYSHYDK